MRWLERPAITFAIKRPTKDNCHLNQTAHNKLPENHAVSWTFSPSNSNGKEKDYESGFHYYGARYHWSEVLTGWLSVDPMADKYPNISPYNYCMWNPVKLVDLDGRDTIFSFATNTQNGQQNIDNQKILSFARTEGNILGVTSVAMHGSKDGKNIYMSDASGSSELRLNPELFIKYIAQLPIFEAPDYKSNVKAGATPIFILYSCNTGGGQNSFAEQLSSKTSGLVIAPSGSLYVGSQGSCYIEDSNGENTGVWNVFCNGNLVDSFPGTQHPKDWISNKGGSQNVISSL